MKTKKTNQPETLPKQPSPRRAAFVAALATALLTALVVWWFNGREGPNDRADRADRDLAAAKLAMDIGNFATAEEHLRSAVERMPESAVLQHNLGVLYLRMDRKADARAAFERAAKAHPPEAQAVRAEEYFQLASISVTEKDWKRAEGELQQAIAADPNRRLFHARLIDLQLGSLKEPAAAESSAARFLRTCGDDAENLHAIGFIYTQQKDYVRAEFWGREAVARDDTVTKAHALVANSLARQGRGREAVQYLAPLLEKQPRNGELWIARARVAMSLGDRRAVIEAADQAVRALPNSFEAHLIRMQALGGAGRLEEAVAEAGRARAVAADATDHRRLRTEEATLQRALQMQNRLIVGGAAGSDTTGARP